MIESIPPVIDRKHQDDACRLSAEGRGDGLEAILRHGISAMFVTGLLFCSVSAVADIYKYEDRNGKLHFTDRPMKGSGYRLLGDSSTRQKNLPARELILHQAIGIATSILP